MQLGQTAGLQTGRIQPGQESEIRPRSYKTFFMLNSTEHENFHALKCNIYEQQK